MRKDGSATPVLAAAETLVAGGGMGPNSSSRAKSAVDV
jgi:hypothetical protein